MANLFERADFPVDPDTVIYKSANTNFVAAALAADLMTYLDAEVDDAGRVVFLLEDLGNRGALLERHYSRRVFTRVHPALFMEARNFLQSEVARVKGATHDQTK